MVKKIIDIFPPKKSKEYYQPLTEEEIREEKKLTPAKRRKTDLLKGGLFFFLFCLIFIFVVFHFFLAKAEIEIWPGTETLSFNEKVTIDAKTDTLDLISRVIPGKIFEIEKSMIEEFSSSGKSLKKAQGLLRLYNSYSTQPEVWQAGTRFVSSEGKLFLSKSKINVPGATLKNGKIVPAYVDVPVIAAEGGADYNIGLSHFSVFVYRGTPRYTKFYGESFAPMTGGGEVAQVTKEDLERAEGVLNEKVKAESEAALESKIPQGFVFLNKIVETKILEKKSSVGVGAEAEKFNFQIKIKSATISFSSKDMEDFAVLLMLSLLEEGKEISRASLKNEYQPEIINLESGKVILSLNLSAKIYSEIELSSLKKALISKSVNEAKVLLENQPGIAHSKIRLFPFWLKNIPDRLEKVNIELRGVD